MATPSSDRRSVLSRLLDAEMLVALSAVVIGVCALVVSVVQVKMMHEQQHASVWPRLVIMPSYNNSGLHLDVSNPGIGPAIIRYVKVSVDGTPTSRWRTALTTLLPEHPPTELTLSTIGDRIIPPGEAVRTLHLSNSDEAALLVSEIGRLQMEICYCSVYHRCWNLAAAFTRRALPLEVDSCPSPNAEMFEN